MTDDARTDEPDARDERIAARLEVPPLDAVTRRRLVRRTLAELGPSGTGRGARMLRVAAVLAALVVVVGTAALILREDGTGDQDAIPRRTGPAAEDPAPEALDAAPAGLADLGEISDPSVLLQRLEAAGALDPGPPAAAETADEAEAEAGESLAPRCRTALADLGAGPPTFVATASDGGTPVLVVVAPVAGEDAPPGATAIVLEAATCAPVGAVPLG